MCRTTSAPRTYTCGHREDGYEYLDCADYLKDGSCATRATVDYWAGSKRAKGDCPSCASDKEKKAKDAQGKATYESHFSRLITEAEEHTVRRKRSVTMARRKVIAKCLHFLSYIVESDLRYTIIHSVNTSSSRKIINVLNDEWRTWC